MVRYQHLFVVRSRLCVTMMTMMIIVTMSLCWLKEATCLAAPSPLSSSSSQQQQSQLHGEQPNADRLRVKVVSINKNNGREHIIELPPRYDSTASSSSTTTRFSRGIQRIRIPTIPSRWTGITDVLRTTFLPTGFPDTVPENFVAYCMWSCIQDMTTQLRGVLATQSVLAGVGVGQAGATTLSALFNYLVRDGCGMFATLLFTYAASSKFSADIKRWRILADCSVDIGITLELISTILPRHLFLPAICIGNVFKAICGVAAGASGGAINLFWSSRGSSIAEINAKFGALHTVTGALGLLLAGLFAKSVHQKSNSTLWFFYGALTLVHIVANIRCMRLVSFNYYNTVRMETALRHYFTDDQHRIPTPEEVAKQESLWFFIPRLYSKRLARRCPIHFGLSFTDFYLRSGKSLDQWKYLDRSNIHNDNGYIISSTSKGDAVVVCFLEDATPRKKVKAYFHSILLSQELQQLHGNSTANCYPVETTLIEASAQKKLDSLWDDWADRAKKAGWNLDSSIIETKGFEVREIHFAGSD